MTLIKSACNCLLGVINPTVSFSALLLGGQHINTRDFQLEAENSPD